MATEAEFSDPQRYIELVGFTGSWRELWYNRDFLRLMAHRLDFANVQRVLDVGCGAAHWGRALLPHLPASAELVGVDREEAFIELARKETDPARSSFAVATAEDLPYPDESFDLVTCQTVLIHVADPLAVLREMKRVLRPGGILLAAEPDNRAGNLALLGGEPRISDDDTVTIVRLLLACERGKLALGEGDQSIGPRVAGLMGEAGLGEVMAYNNDRCMSFYPPYDRGDMRVARAQELAWSADDVSILCGSRHDNWRYFEAAGGSADDFATAWEAVRRWMQLVREGMDANRYHAARGFVMYLTAGRKPSAP